MPRTFRLSGDMLDAIVIVIVSVILFWITTTFEEVPEIVAQGIQPDLFPQIIISLIVFLAIVMAYQGRAKNKTAKSIKPMATYTAIFVLLFAVSIHWIGSVPAMIFACVALPLLWGERRYVGILIFAILFPIGVYLLFTKALDIRFPLGIFTNFFN
jgi:hypothetical protein